MKENVSRNSNIIITIFKFAAFIILFCFIYSFTKQAWIEVKVSDVRSVTLLSGIFFAFFFYAFIADLNNVYKAVQGFFFRGSSMSFIFSALLILLALFYFLSPSVFAVSLNNHLFIFLNGFIFTVHLMYIARDKKGSGFSAYTNYLFSLSALYLVNLFIWLVCVNAAVSLPIDRVVVNGFKEGYVIVLSLFRRIA